MVWVIYYALLLLAYVLASVYSIYHPDRTPEVIKSVSGALTLITALAKLSRVPICAFIFSYSGFWVWWHGDKTAVWRFALRLDGGFGTEVIADLNKSFQRPELSNWPSQILTSNDREARIKMDRTIHLHITYEPEFVSGDGEDHILIRSDELEVPYGRAREKIDRQITPLLSAFISVLRPRA
jgi:hypothetical protein